MLKKIVIGILCLCFLSSCYSVNTRAFETANKLCEYNNGVSYIDQNVFSLIIICNNGVKFKMSTNSKVFYNNKTKKWENTETFGAVDNNP